MRAVVTCCVLVALLGAARPSTAADSPATTTCRKLPSGKRVVRLSLKPDTEVGDLVIWISSITCRQFLFSGGIDVHGKKVTIFAPRLITPAEAYGLFLDALDSVGLTVVPQGRFLRVVETAAVRTFPIPFYVGKSTTDSSHAEQEHREEGKAGSGSGQVPVDGGGRVRP